MTGTLYLIPNSLGHALNEDAPLAHIIPEDVQAATAKLDYFVAENAKTTRAFLNLVSRTRPLSRPLQEITINTLNVKTPNSELPALLQPIIDGRDGGLISESGIPAVADPGANLVKLAHEHHITVKPFVGPSSLLLALMASGLNGQSFAFNGYLPVNAGERIKRIKALELHSQRERQTQIFIETPYRNQQLLEALSTQCQPNTLICVATDLTGKNESVQTLSATQWEKRLKSGKTPDFHRKPTVFLFLVNK